MDRIDRLRHSARTALRITLTLAGLWLPGARPAHADYTGYYNWNGAVSGNTDDPNRWLPVGVPGPNGYLNFGAAGTYSVLFTGTPSTSGVLGLAAGNVTLNLHLSFPHTTGECYVTAPGAVLGQGRLNADFLHVGLPGFFSTLTLRGATSQMHSIAQGNPYTTGDCLGYDGISQFNIESGARYYSEGTGYSVEIASRPTASSSMNVTGSSGAPRIYSGFVITGSQDFLIAPQGTADVYFQNGGFGDVASDILIARDPGSTGYVNVGPVAGTGTSSLTARGRMLIGRNYTYDIPTGRAELTVKNRAFARSWDRTEVGSPGGDNQCVLRVLQGGAYTTYGGLRVYDTPGLGLDLQGGLTRVMGGAFEWPANRALSLTSTVGTPELWISGGVASSGPTGASASLRVGRSGTGTLRLTRPGTVLTVGPADTWIADSLGGSGTVVVDSSASFTTTAGRLLVGFGGTGRLDVLHGGMASVGQLELGSATGSTGHVLVRGPGSLVQASRVSVGGTIGATPGLGSLTIDSSAVLEVVNVTPLADNFHVNPSTGLLNVGSGGLLHAGAVYNSDRIDLMGGTFVVERVVNNLGPGYFTGYGSVARGAAGGALYNAGWLSPNSPSSLTGSLRVEGDFTQTASGRYEVDLDALPACDTLQVVGTASLSGTLQLNTLAGFTPILGQWYTILTASQVTGTFSAVTWNGAPLTTQATIVYTPYAVLVVIGSSTAGVTPEETRGGPSAVSFAARSFGARLGFDLDLPARADVTVAVFDASGREVAHEGSRARVAGRHHIEPPCAAGALAPGVYFGRVRVRTPEWETTRTARAFVLR